jgi:uncharacterized repeat protein (TIGR01451 family)
VNGRSTVTRITLALWALLLGMPAGVIAQTFHQAPTVATGDVPRSVAAGDFNLDGKTDLAVANGLSDDVSVLLGDGAGGFAPAVNHPVVGPIALVSEDFNGDGLLDLAVARSFGKLSIWLGDGTGGFPTQTEVAIIEVPECIGTADFNNDGKVDLAVGLWDPVSSNYAVAILLGDGLGGFSTPVNHEVGYGANSIAAADFNEDLNVDLAVANLHSNTLSLLFGTGTGSFGPYSTVVVGPIWAGPASVTAADFNEDGWVDLASANSGTDDVRILSGNGAGGFSPPAAYPAGYTAWVIDTADFNGDLKLDLAVANRYADTVLLYAGDGAGGFHPMTAGYGVGRQPVSLVITDLNGDGAADVATANADEENDTPGDVSILLGDGAGGFPAAARSYRTGWGAVALAIGELNGDANPDLVAANPGTSDISVLLGAGKSMFQPTVNYLVYGNVHDVEICDFNNDGHPDLAAVIYGDAGVVAVLLNKGDGSFGSPTFFTAIQFPDSLAVTDFNEDGNKDLFVHTWGVGAVILLGNGHGGFAPGGFYGTGAGEGAAVAVGDFNADGNADVAVAKYSTSSVSIGLGNGSGGFASAVMYPAGPGPHAIAVGDLNGDGKEDLVVGNSIPSGSPPGLVTILLGNGTGAFGAPVSYLTGDMTASVAVGDFNGDGRQDVAAGNFSSHGVSILSGVGSGALLPAVNLIVGSEPHSLVVGDFDADGKSDLAVLHSPSPGDVWVLLNTTVFQKADLAVTKDDGTAVAIPGSPLSYTITVTNLGPDSVTSLKLKDAVPAALLGPVFTPSTGSYDPGTGLWTGLSLAAGQGVTLTLSGTVSPMATGTLVNTATVATEVGVLDPISANDSATDTDTVAPAANLVLTMTDSPDPVPAGGALTYALTVSNLGPLVATAVTLFDPLPAAVTFVSASPDCTASGATVTCPLGNLGPGASRVVSIHATANRYTMATNTASASANEVDPAAGNNVASAETQILVGSEGELTHGTVLWRNLAALPGPVAKEDLYRLGRQPRSSYEVVVDSASGDVSGGSGALLQRVAADLTTVLQDSAPVAVGFGRSLRFENASAETIVDEAIRVRSAGCTTDCGPDDVYRIRAYETTYAIARFNNTGGQVTVLVIQNHGDEAVAGNIWFWGTTGTLLTSQSVALEAKATLVLNTTTVPGLAGASGSITVSSDGAYGALGGKAVALDPSSGFSSDTPMVARTE